MAHKHLKNSGIAAIVLGCALGVAQAAGTTSPPIDPSQLQTLLNLLKPKPGVPLSQTGGGRLTPGPSNVVGWNFKICTESFSTTAAGGSLTGTFAVNSDGSFFAERSSGVHETVQAQLLAACQHAGGGYWVHVLDPTTNVFDYVLIYYP